MMKRINNRVLPPIILSADYNLKVKTNIRKVMLLDTRKTEKR